MNLRSTSAWPSLLVASTFLLLSIGWAFASPHGSSADEDFHAINIWCSGGGSDLCEETADGTGVFVPRTLSRSQCYVNWPARFSAACLQEIPDETEYTTRVLFDKIKYSPLYYSTMRFLAGNNVEVSIQVMRVFNSLIAASLLLWALLATSLSIRRSVALTWGAAMIPVGVFFIASINPSSWVITSIGLYWAFLASLLTPEGILGKRKWNLLAGMVIAVVLGLGARTDAGIYLVISTVAVLIWRWPFVRSHLSHSMKIAGGVFALILAAISAFIFWNRYGVLSLSFPGASMGQPNPALKTLMEFPSFLMGLLGGQEPKYVIANTDVSMAQEGYRPTGFTFGIGWTETHLPSLVAIGVGFVVAGLIALAIGQATKGRLIAAGFIVVVMATQILLMLAVFDFNYVAPIQPRYFFPLALAALGILLASENLERFVTRVHAVVFVSILTISGTVAFLATSARYAIGPHAAMANFGYPLDWWWEWEYAPGRLAFTGIMAMITLGWVLATIWIFPARLKPNQVDSLQSS